MGLLDLIKGDRVYLDANIWIYASEGVSDYSQSLSALFEAVDAGLLKLVTSELSLAEILVRPIKEGNVLEQETYTEAITSTDGSTSIPINREILIRAAGIRANTKLKLPDAIHAATAINAGCTTFLTNDKQFRTVQDLYVLLISQIPQEPD
jgi:predicted nucleic acid-binding protein